VACRIVADQEGRQFDALGLAAGKCAAGLAELDIAQAYVEQRFESAVDISFWPLKKSSASSMLNSSTSKIFFP
jgi:hypothetical protein